MTIAQNHRDLFVHADASNKLDLFQSLLDAQELTSNEALALLSAVHAQLRQPKANPSSLYMRYAEAVQSLRRRMPDVHDQVVSTWHAGRGTVRVESKPAEAPSGDFWDEPDLVRDRSVAEPPQVRHPANEAKQSAAEIEGIEEPHEGSVEGPEAEFEPEEAESEEKADEKPEVEPEEQDEEPGQDEAREPEGKTEEVQDREEKEEPGELEVSAEETEENAAEQEEAAETESEPAEEVETERETTETSEPADSKNESAEEGERMAVEAAEAAAESEHVEIDLEETPGEEEPPVEGAE